MLVATWAGLALCLVGLVPSVAAAQVDALDAPRGYVRVDTNLKQNQFWLGGVLPVAQSFDLISDLLLENRALELDLGVGVHAGGLALFPTLGLSFDAGQREFDRFVVPRLVTILDAGPLYLESWVQLTLRDALQKGNDDDFYTRDLLLIVPHQHLGVGLQTEWRWILQRHPGSNLINAAFGGNLSTRWDRSTFALFLGYDFAKLQRDVTGRFTFVQTF